MYLYLIHEGIQQIKRKLWRHPSYSSHHYSPLQFSSPTCNQTDLKSINVSFLIHSFLQWISFTILFVRQKEGHENPFIIIFKKSISASIQIRIQHFTLMRVRSLEPNQLGSMAELWIHAWNWIGKPLTYFFASVGIFQLSYGGRKLFGIGLCYRPTGYIGWWNWSQETIPGLLKSLKIRTLTSFAIQEPEFGSRRAIISLGLRRIQIRNNLENN